MSISQKFNIPITKREIECIIHLCSGLTVREIARTLHLSPDAIKFYLANIKEKLDCQTKAALEINELDISYYLIKGY